MACPQKADFNDSLCVPDAVPEGSDQNIHPLRRSPVDGGHVGSGIESAVLTKRADGRSTKGIAAASDDGSSKGEGRRSHRPYEPRVNPLHRKGDFEQGFSWRLREASMAVRSTPRYQCHHPGRAPGMAPGRAPGLAPRLEAKCRKRGRCNWRLLYLFHPRWG